ncbi:MAG: Tm-1-like ATP-binding domain-containing protein, partial [Gemmataceae bacterium]
MPVLLLATLDTKGPEAAFVRDLLVNAGVPVTVADGGVLGPPAFAPDITREELFRAAGTTLDAVRGDRGRAVQAAAKGAAALARRLLPEGVFGLGGSAGTTIATAAMRELAVGVPKVMVSTLASGQVRPYVGVRDVCMIHSVVDIAGLNRVSRRVLANAAHALIGMLAAPREDASDRPVVAATMFGVTTPCVEAGRAALEAAGYEVLVFHATGTGGLTMEGLVRDGGVSGVFDVTTTELADELVGGTLSAGPDRLTAASLRGVPQVIGVGALDMVN